MLTGVAHFLAIEASNSVVICRLSSRAFTVKDEPIFVKSVVT